MSTKNAGSLGTLEELLTREPRFPVQKTRRAVVSAGLVGAGLFATQAGGDPLVFLRGDYTIVNAGQATEYAELVLEDGSTLPVPAGTYHISPDGELILHSGPQGDLDRDGIANAAEDTNGNGNLFDDDDDGDLVPNFIDSLGPVSDTNGDGVPDGLEDTDGNGSVLNDDADGDHIPDYADTEKMVAEPVVSSVYSAVSDKPGGALLDAGILVLASSGAAAAGLGVLAVIDNRPTFDDVSTTYISEDAVNGTGPDATAGATAGTVLDINAYKDGSNSADTGITYSFDSGNDTGRFNIGADGKITVADAYQIDFEADSSYDLVVRATDTARGVYQTLAITIDVDDVTEVTPTAPTTTTFNVQEDNSVAATTVVGGGAINLGTYPTDTKWELDATATAAGFSIDQSTGNLLLPAIDLENLPTGVSQVAYSGSGADVGGSQGLTFNLTATSITGDTSTHLITINVDGKADEDPGYAPPFTSSPSLSSLNENYDGSGTGAPLSLGFVASYYDNGEYDTTGQNLSFSTTSTLFTVDSSTGEIKYVGPGEDYEILSTQPITLTVTDASTASNSDYLTVYITDLAPTADDGTSGTSSSNAPLVDVDGTQHYQTVLDVNMTEGAQSTHQSDDDTLLTYAVTGQPSDGTKFAIDSSTGELYLTCIADDKTTYSSGSPHKVTVTATESGGTATHTQDFYIDLA